MKQTPLNANPSAALNGLLAVPSQSLELPRGMAAAHELPHPPFHALWDAILVEDGTKDRLLAQTIVTFQLRPRVDASRFPLHGLVVLVGPPGTGKTSLARGLASRTAEVLSGMGTFQYVEIDPHSLMSAGLGRSQQAVQRLLGETIPELAARGPTIVLLDELEAFAADRVQLSLQANPIDVHRTTNAVLSGIDQLAADHPELLFLATSNFEGAVDSALLSRADLVETIPLPGADTARTILADTVMALADLYATVASIIDDPAFAAAAAACAGLDGRQIRKLVATALTFDKQTAINPHRLTCGDLIRAAKGAHRGRSA